MTWDDLTNALNNLTDDVSYLAVDDDGYITLRIGKIVTIAPQGYPRRNTRNLVEEVLRYIIDYGERGLLPDDPKRRK